MRKNNTRSTNKWLIWSIILLILIIFGLFVYALSKETAKKKRVEDEINLLKKEAEKIEMENMALNDRIAYLSSKDYREIQAKDKFNLQSPDENVIIINQEVEKVESSPKIKEKISDEELFAKIEIEKIPNYKKWWKYFFK